MIYEMFSVSFIKKKTNMYTRKVILNFQFQI